MLRYITDYYVSAGSTVNILCANCDDTKFLNVLLMYSVMIYDDDDDGGGGGGGVSGEQRHVDVW